MKFIKNYMDSRKHQVTYHPKLAFIRLTILLILILFIWFLILNLDSFIKEKDSDSNDEYILKNIFKDNQIIEENSRGTLFSLSENVKAEGKIVLVKNESKTYLELRSFKITNNPNLELYLSKDEFNRARILIAERLLANIGTQRYEIPSKIDLDTHKYLQFWDKSINKSVAYGIIENP